MPWLSATIYETLTRDPYTIAHVCSSGGPAFRALIGAVLVGKPIDLQAAALCAAVTYDWKLYGESTALTLDALVTEPALDGENYATLAARWSWLPETARSRIPCAAPCERSRLCLAARSDSRPYPGRCDA